MFDINYDRPRNLIEATLAGFLSVPEVEQYAAKVEPLIHRAAALPRGYLMLIDVSGCSIQSQVVVTAFQQHVADVPRARRCAFVTGSSMVRMQIRRIIGQSTMQMFDSCDGAREWLLLEKAVPAS